MGLWNNIECPCRWSDSAQEWVHICQEHLPDVDRNLMVYHSRPVAADALISPAQFSAKPRLNDGEPDLQKIHNFVNEQRFRKVESDELDWNVVAKMASGHPEAIGQYDDQTDEVVIYVPLARIEVAYVDDGSMN